MGAEHRAVSGYLCVHGRSDDANAKPGSNGGNVAAGRDAVLFLLDSFAWSRRFDTVLLEELGR